MAVQKKVKIYYDFIPNVMTPMMICFMVTMLNFGNFSRLHPNNGDVVDNGDRYRYDGGNVSYSSCSNLHFLVNC